MRAITSTTEPVEPGSAPFVAGDLHLRPVRVLGQRAHGELVLARRRHREGGLGGLVVIKRLERPEHPEARRRLLEEAKLALRLEHPAIARVLHVETYQGAPYLVLEYVRGLSLEGAVSRACLRRRPLSEAFAAYVGAEVADALHYAHGLQDGRGRPLRLIHRDVSPRNIRLGKAGEVKLTDFGVARSRLPGRRSTTGPLVKGDTGYASPEALCRGALDARSDLFSLGLVLLEALTNLHPYDPPGERARMTVAADFFRRMRGKLRAQEEGWAPVTELAARAAGLRPEDVERLARGVSAPLRAVVQRALRVSPDERFATAADMRDALRACLSRWGQPYGRQEALAELRELVEETEAARRELGMTEDDLVPHALRG